MKKIVFITICVLGIICFSSCVSTNRPCGLADNNTTLQKTIEQVVFS